MPGVLCAERASCVAEQKAACFVLLVAIVGRRGKGGEEGEWGLS